MLLTYTQRVSLRCRYVVVVVVVVVENTCTKLFLNF